MDPLYNGHLSIVDFFAGPVIIQYTLCTKNSPYNGLLYNGLFPIMDFFRGPESKSTDLIMDFEQDFIKNDHIGQ